MTSLERLVSATGPGATSMFRSFCMCRPLKLCPHSELYSAVPSTRISSRGQFISTALPIRAAPRP
eukprot:CAMPEP_0181251452 /NCGR_PEP_ID=MMETSP1096-20121128/46893_1 /TAXON_ID=156174 ORGANISM="Chrysochromulina ericina, Strain CCMP281" /NCGR_SAMPLE_ID=MMETSP1096 /ASSEMBLY_ACC=CAM_ASM_000453 /LENGTH=64 /DNA_ID=CAMNT_0023349053 /DNA_START=1386 /DNA_END=1577 /DNA_ORIENTATION=-